MRTENPDVGAVLTHHDTKFRLMFISECQSLLELPSYAVKQGDCIIALLDKYEGPLSCELYDGSGSLCELGFYHTPDEGDPIIKGYSDEKEIEIRRYLLFYSGRVGAIVETSDDLWVYSKTCWKNKCVPMTCRC